MLINMQSFNIIWNSVLKNKINRTSEIYYIMVLNLKQNECSSFAYRNGKLPWYCDFPVSGAIFAFGVINLLSTCTNGRSYQDPTDLLLTRTDSSSYQDPTDLLSTRTVSSSYQDPTDLLSAFPIISADFLRCIYAIITVYSLYVHGCGFCIEKF